MENHSELLIEIEKIKDEFIESMKNTIIYNKINKTKQCNIILCDQMRTTAGKAYYNFNTIKLNKRLFLENRETFKNTIGHELAHLINYEVYEKTGHGLTWKNIMNMLGLNPKRCHSFKVKIRKHKLKNVICECLERKVTSRIFNNIKKGTIYICQNCNFKLRTFEC